jgi:hypothetical protein
MAGDSCFYCRMVASHKLRQNRFQAIVPRVPITGLLSDHPNNLWPMS